MRARYPFCVGVGVGLLYGYVFEIDDMRLHLCSEISGERVNRYVKTASISCGPGAQRARTP